MRHIIGLVLLVLLLPSTILAESAGSPVLDAALSMLEDGNPFLQRYRDMTGRDVEARFELGCPYFWGGRSVRRILDTMQPWQSSSAYYRTSRSYLYGFDCVGFPRWVLEEAGFARQPSISDLLDLPEYTALEIPGTAGVHGKALAELLIPGDLLVIRHEKRSYHIAMYAGTLRDYGYDADTAGDALAACLDYPLLVHCTVHPDYYERYEAWIEDAFDWRVYPPDGGVIVSILDVPESTPVRSMLSPLNTMQTYFDLEGYRLLTYSSDKDELTRWIRWWET